MLYLLCFLIFGLIVGSVAKLLHPGEDPGGLFPTLAIGVAGSYLGGLLSFFLGLGTSPFHPAGILMSVVGGVILCWLYRQYRLRNK